MNRLIPNLPTFEEATLENCEAILINLNARRFVVVRVEEPKNLWPVHGGWEKIRQLQPGDEVIYKGQKSTVKALDVYR